MFRLQEMPRVRALEYIDRPPLHFKDAQPTQTDMLAARAAIFRMVQGEPQLLLLQRAETDSLPGCWELPGGGVEDSDGDLKTALYREIKEETGLTVAWIIQEVGEGERWEKVKEGTNYHFMCVTFVVEIEEIELWERGMSQQMTPDELVKLSDAEHQDQVWVTEEQLKARKAGDRAMLKLTRDMQTVMLEAFELQKQIIAAKQAV